MPNSSNAPKFLPIISLGNILTLISGVTFAFVILTQITNNVQANTSDVAGLKAADTRIEHRVDELERSNGLLRAQLAGMHEKLDLLLNYALPKDAR